MSNYNPPEVQLAPPPPGSNGSIYSSVGAMSKANAETQNNLNKIGGRRRRSRRSRKYINGGAPPGPIIAHAAITNAPASATTQSPVTGNNTITVPTVKPLYPETGSGSQTTAANVTNSTKVGAELNANKQYDACVGQDASCGQITVTTGQKGGRRKTRGGWPHWGCMSGGKYRTNKRKRSNKRRRTNKRKRR